MRKVFSEPYVEVIRFNSSDVVKTSCYCNVAGEDWGYGYNDTPCGAGYNNNPECICIADNPINCV